MISNVTFQFSAPRNNLGIHIGKSTPEHLLMLPQHKQPCLGLSLWLPILGNYATNTHASFQIPSNFLKPLNSSFSEVSVE